MVALGSVCARPRSTEKILGPGPPNGNVGRVRVVDVHQPLKQGDRRGSKVTVGTNVPTTESFDRFYQREHGRLLSLAFVLTRSWWHAEDLVQLAFTEAHRRWDDIGRYDDPAAWVRRVVLNRRVSLIRRWTSEAKAMTRLAARRSEPVDPTDSLAEVRDAVRRLPTRQAQAIALFYFDDCSQAQIADILGCSSETVKTHLKRGRSALRRDLKGWDV